MGRERKREHREREKQGEKERDENMGEHLSGMFDLHLFLSCSHPGTFTKMVTAARHAPTCQ